GAVIAALIVIAPAVTLPTLRAPAAMLFNSVWVRPTFPNALVPRSNIAPLFTLPSCVGAVPLLTVPAIFRSVAASAIGPLLHCTGDPAATVMAPPTLVIVTAPPEASFRTPVPAVVTAVAGVDNCVMLISPDVVFLAWTLAASVLTVIPVAPNKYNCKNGPVLRMGWPPAERTEPLELSAVTVVPRTSSTDTLPAAPK